MKISKQIWATLGLVFITFLAAIQYVFLRNVPDDVSTFSFVCITNVIGLVILGAARIKKLLGLRKRTLLKGVLLAAELTGMNVFILLGSRKMDAVVISSVVSLYFVFITPMLLLMRKKVNFFSGIASVIAIVALLLMFGADTEQLFSSVNVGYLILADVFFAAYVVTVSVFGEKEDSTQLTLSQMLFSALFALVGWVAESLLGGRQMVIPQQTDFWISALFIGVGIRAVYGLIQISAQKHVSALKTSLIFSAEIVITLMMNPLLCRWLNTEYTPATTFQIIGAVLLIIATLMVDDNVMIRLGFGDLKEETTVNEKGETVQKGSVARKMILTTLTFTMVTLVVSTVMFLSAIYLIRTDAVKSSENLGESASSISSEAMMEKLEESIQSQATDKALLAEQKLNAYSNSALYAASYAHTLYMDPEHYPDREVNKPSAENAGKWTMQRGIANKDIPYESLQAENRLLGNLLDVFIPIVKNNENVATIYIGTESGLMLAYDPNSFDLEEGEEELYYEFRDLSWYRKGKAANGYVFSDTYQDSYGRGLTITCVAPFTDADGNFAGVIGIDILMDELNTSMVNDGIVDPSVAVLIDHEGKLIAGKDVDPRAENPGSIFDEGRNETLRTVGKEILERKNGVVSVGVGEAADYIAFATIGSTDWTLCIKSPVYSVIKPALMIREDIDANTDRVVSTVRSGIMNVIQSCLLLSALILLFVTLFTGRSSRRITEPLKQLESDVRQISGGNLERRVSVSSNDEIGSLANSFNNMTDSLQHYIADLKEVTAKEERIAGELTAARNIQASMLPRHFGEFTAAADFDLFATMDPAKEVGGDFYDFFRVDDDHVALVMADVCGKGVPAALFMAISKALIKDRAQRGQSPAKILSDVNERLLENNEAEQFVTVWIAVIELSTGKGLAANAGHEHPVIRRGNGRYELVEYRHSPAVATMSGIRFREHEFQLNPGDSLFVYTDGLPEATNADNEMFGAERMLAAMNRNPGASPRELLKTVRGEIDRFVGDAPQFDDITMLNFQYAGGRKADGASQG